MLLPETSSSATSNRGKNPLKSQGYHQEQPRKWAIFHSKGLKRDQGRNAGLCEMPGMDQFGKFATEYLIWSQLIIWDNKMLEQD